MDLIKTIKQSSNVLVVCHIRPDGDCLGAGFAMTALIDSLGRNVDFVCDSDFPEHYAFIKGYKRLNDIRFSDYDLGISVDCADEFRLGKYSDEFFECKNTVNIDHHATNTKFAGENIVDAKSSSTCEILFYMLQNSGLINASIAEYLFMGISTDTGHFHHSNTSPKTFSAAAELIKYDFNATLLTDNLYRSNPIGKLKLVGLALNKMRFFFDNKVCIIALSQKDLAECDCKMADTEGIIDYPMTISDVVVAVCMSQQSPVSFKVSFRSKSVDVAKVAGKFGGGGHILASGCVVNGDFNTCVNKVVEAISDEL